MTLMVRALFQRVAGCTRTPACCHSRTSLPLASVSPQAALCPHNFVLRAQEPQVNGFIVFDISDTFWVV